MFIRGAYNYDVDAASLEAGFVCGDGVSATKQSFKDECDINVIVDKFMKTGAMPENVRMPVAADYSEVLDFRGMMNSIVQARESFDEMPAPVRARFHNDPAEFVDFCLKDENWDEALKMGLISDEAVARQKAKIESDRKAALEQFMKDEAAAKAAAAAKPTG